MQARPPVIAVMGHVDHGKSALLDYIRKTNVVAGEAGGITQHVSAYEVEHEHEGTIKKITFIDTPGHEAFKGIRARGARVADVAILVVSAEDGVKPQTLDALSAIKEAGIPYVVAINKIDKPGANVVRTQTSLIENEIYIEGMGGDIPWNAISAKTGEGVSELLDTILLVAEMEELSGDPSAYAEGVVIEAHRDPKKGVMATLLIKNGTLKSGEFVLAHEALAPVRIFEDFTGTPIKEATFSSPVRIIGFDSLPEVGAPFAAYKSKKDAEQAREEYCAHTARAACASPTTEEDAAGFVIPLILKADASGSLEAIVHEVAKLKSDRVVFKIIQSGIGAVSEDDVRKALASEDALVIAFHVKTDANAREAARQGGIGIETFAIIYELAEYLTRIAKERTPKREVAHDIGRSKILRVFSSVKDTTVLGGSVKEGVVTVGARGRIMRHNTHVGEAKLLNAQTGKQDVQKVEAGEEFGAKVQSNVPIAEGDMIEWYETVIE